MIRIFVLLLALASTSVFAESDSEQWLNQCISDNKLNPGAMVYCSITFSSANFGKHKFIENLIPSIPFIGTSFLPSKTGDTFKANATQSQSHQSQQKSHAVPKPLPYY